VDALTETELSRFSNEKLAERWRGKPAQRQVLSNVLAGRNISRQQRQRMAMLMEGAELRELAHVVAEVLEGA
jgi:hypothetical protein